MSRAMPESESLEHAARWIACDRRGSEAEVRAWLARDEANVGAALRVAGVWDDLGSLADDPDIVAGLTSPPRAANDRGFGGWRAAGLGVVMITAAWWLAPPSAVAYETRRGETRTVDAPRGVRLILNTATRVRVEYGWFERRIILEQGEVDAAATPALLGDARLFAAGMQLTSKGGRAVLRDDGVVALEGTLVHVASGTPVSAGTALRKGPRGIERRRLDDPSMATAWQRGVVVFEDASLPAALAEFARYRPVHVRLDPRASTLRISGTYRVDEVDGFARTLTRVHPVALRRDANGTKVVSLISK